MAQIADVTELSDRSTEPVQRGEMPYEPAGHPERALAFAIDVVIVWVGMLVVGVLLGYTGVFQIAVLGDLVNWLIRAAGLAYFPYLWIRGGQTIGMLPVSQRVVRSADLGPIDIRTALIRLAGLALAIVTVIGVLWVLRDPKRQGLHDKLAGTLVISG